MNDSRPLVERFPCEHCKGSGRDEKKTAKMYARDSSSSCYIECRLCNGNGLDNAAVFFSHRKEMDEWWKTKGSKPS